VLEELLDDLTEDAWRAANPFSSDIVDCHAELFDSAASVEQIASLLLRWIRANQPCIFGRAAAAQKRVAVCVIRERDLRKGDDFVASLILDHHQIWRADALKGLQHGFLVALVSRRVALAEPSLALKRLALRLGSLYLGNVQSEAVRENDILLDEIFLDLREGLPRKWKVGANYFSSQGDQRWWHDHRVPGGILLSMNSVGHMARALHGSKATPLADPHSPLVDWALPTAMQTIDVAQRGGRGGTRLESRGTFEGDEGVCPFDPARGGKYAKLAEHSWNGYRGLYHTDVTIPPEYFYANAERPADLVPHHDLDFTYLHLDTEEAFRTMGCGVTLSLEEFDALQTREEDQS
jgi:hypothetical protein